MTFVDLVATGHFPAAATLYMSAVGRAGSTIAQWIGMGAPAGDPGGARFAASVVSGAVTCFTTWIGMG
ncbi:hypothetical protein [Actinokineospora inagensis]|uniref:hypothetical protein n=1 Tax=Actinokineospora inagensis TaxID=103730 RepID=UPI00041AA4B0|nr:hypothetical protein [Actinokineospora inagensis]